MHFLLYPLLLIFFSTHLEPNKKAEWGFHAHKKINEIAIFSLPPEMIVFYKHHMSTIIERSVNPDKRRYINENEGPRHFIDLDAYGSDPLAQLPKKWQEAIEQYGDSTLTEHGIVPWHMVRVKYYLTQAFLNQDADQILKISADLGHYVGDAHVPLHTTSNYNGQKTNQRGIHGFWESRLPELFDQQYDLFVGKAEYIENVNDAAWNAVANAHLALDSVLIFEAQISQEFSPTKKYSFEVRGNQTVKVYSYEFSEAYHQRLQGMVERKMRASIKLIADLWFTCWVDGGQPTLNKLILEDNKIIKRRIDSLLIRDGSHGRN
ncbi:zinc dependent phospholipase C family protein [Cyclobacteriaceae bacterium]|nr:zinc dependent phospholipase C family protein [Cyclobacteriaceae bacterium]MDC6484034.1 zinc dependent phospholipase C family protein [Cyclobacteriaceae bacterium]